MPAGRDSGTRGLTPRSASRCPPSRRRQTAERAGNDERRLLVRWQDRTMFFAYTRAYPRALGRRSPRRLNLGSRRRIASSRLLLNAVMQLNHTILEAINGVQIQRHVTMTPRYQWDAVPNENGDHTDDELVDRQRVQKRGDDLATAHQPDGLA